MTFNFLGPGLTVNVEAKVKEQIILDSSESLMKFIAIDYHYQLGKNLAVFTIIFSLSLEIQLER